MKKVLLAKHHEDGYNLMVRGSQIVVLTDALSKQPEIKDDVIHYASGEGICIHFFISNPGDALADGIYQEIADNTHGTLISSFSQWDLANFVAKYEENEGCQYLISRKKRSAAFSCKSVTVSRLASNLRLSINARTGSGLTITQPNGVVREPVVAQNNFVLLNQSNPEHGSWRVCSNDSHSFEVTDVVTY